MHFQGRTTNFAFLAIIVDDGQPWTLGGIIGAAGCDPDVVVAICPPIADLLYVRRGTLRPTLDCWRFPVRDEWKNTEALSCECERSFATGEHFTFDVGSHDVTCRVAYGLAWFDSRFGYR